MAVLLKAPEVIAKENQIKESDITQLPFLQFIVKDIFRLHPTVIIPRKAEADVKVCGCTIPKDAQLQVNVWAISRDSNIWKFLELNIDLKGHHLELIPFGGGHGICPGLPLAVRMLHLMLGSLLHSFDWNLETGLSPESINFGDKLGFTLHMAQPLRAIHGPRA